MLEWRHDHWYLKQRELRLRLLDGIQRWSLRHQGSLHERSKRCGVPGTIALLFSFLLNSVVLTLTFSFFLFFLLSLLLLPFPFSQNGGFPTGWLADGECACTCLSGYEGSNCGTATACFVGPHSKPCRNGANVTGIISKSNCGCECTTDFSGTHCQTFSGTVTTSGCPDTSGGTLSGTFVLDTAVCQLGGEGVVNGVLKIFGDRDLTYSLLTPSKTEMSSFRAIRAANGEVRHFTLRSSSQLILRQLRLTNSGVGKNGCGGSILVEQGVTAVNIDLAGVFWPQETSHPIKGNFPCFFMV